MMNELYSTHSNISSVQGLQPICRKHLLDRVYLRHLHVEERVILQCMLQISDVRGILGST